MTRLIYLSLIRYNSILLSLTLSSFIWSYLTLLYLTLSHLMLFILSYSPSLFLSVRLMPRHVRKSVMLQPLLLLVLRGRILRWWGEKLISYCLFLISYDITSSSFFFILLFLLHFTSLNFIFIISFHSFSSFVICLFSFIPSLLLRTFFSYSVFIFFWCSLTSSFWLYSSILFSSITSFVFFHPFLLYLPLSRLLFFHLPCSPFVSFFLFASYLISCSNLISTLTYLLICVSVMWML